MATPLAKTSDGYEAQFGTNHLGHAYLTKLLLPTMLKTADESSADVRVVMVSSIGHHMAPPGGIIFETDQLMKQTPFELYGQSKLANILFARALAKRYPEITSVAVHPGTIMTELYTSRSRSNVLVRLLMWYVAPLFFGDVHYGALNQLWAATVLRSKVVSGGYYMPVGKAVGGSSYACNEKLADKLWNWTEEEFSRLGV
jgi:NAD(P)-dependent dehydrogenase (short-subunit alcohol dehydrogenase family)